MNSASQGNHNALPMVSGTYGGQQDGMPVVAACFCTSFEQNMYRPQVCLACFHKRSEHSLPNNACGWKNVPKPDGVQVTRRATVLTYAPSLKPDAPTITSPRHETQATISTPNTSIATATTNTTITSTSTTTNTLNVTSSVQSNVKRKISSDNPPPLTSPPKLVPTKSDNSWATRSYSKTHSGSTSQTNLNRSIPKVLNSPRNSNDTDNNGAPYGNADCSPTHTPNTACTNAATPSPSPSASRNQQTVSSPVSPSPPSLLPPQSSQTNSSIMIAKSFSPKNVQRNAVMLPPVKNYTQEYSLLQNFDAAESYSRMIRNLIWISGISVDEKFVKEFLAKLEIETIKHKPAVAWDRRHLRDQALLGLSIKHDIEHVLDQQSQIQKIVIVQSCVRRYLVKKRVSTLKQYQQTPHKERNSIFRDVLKAERGYVSNLSLIVMSYMNPLKAALRSSVFLSSFTLTISPEDLHSIFSNVDVLLRVHATVLGEFEMLLDKWPIIEDIGAIFLKKASDLRVYGEYVRNFQTALHTLTRLQEENSKFSQFVTERMQRNYGDPGLMSLISCPLNQISQYAILLERLVHVTPVGHRDHEKLTAASILMKEIYKLLQDSIEQTNNSAKLMDLQRRIMPHTVDFEMIVPSRMFVCEGGVIHYHKKKKRQCHYALFNDMLLMCRVKKNLLKVKHHFPYSQIVIEEELQPIHLPPGIDTSTTPACGLVVPKDKLVLLFSSKQEQKVFLNKAKPLCEQANPTRRVFGSSLVALLKREKTAVVIPSPLVAMADAIKRNVQVEGIFRVSGTVPSMQALREALEKDELDLKGYDVHTVANGLKAFFREMPEPLMTFPAYDDLASIAEDQHIQSRLQALRVVIANMPKPNRNVLQFLISFLAYVASFADKNKMNVINLAIVMGPNLVRPVQNTLETTLMMPKLNSIISDLIEHSTVVFDKMDI